MAALVTVTATERLRRLAMITLLTRSPRIPLRKRLGAARALWKGNRGPTACANSLMRGLRELGVPHQVNPRERHISGVVHVLSGVGTLAYAINRKREGQITRLIAGPNLVGSPEEANGILSDSTIDLLLVPSPWVKDWMAAEDERLRPRLRVWAAGVAITSAWSSRKTGSCLIYRKSGEPGLYREIEGALDKLGIPWNSMTYGQYGRRGYLRSLCRSDFMIYVGGSESQGLALQEAWMQDVPTLVWSPGVMRYRGHEWRDPQIAAPYLSEEAGRFLREGDEVKATIQRFLAGLPAFQPRRYCLAHLTDRVCAGRYLEAVEL